MPKRRRGCGEGQLSLDPCSRFRRKKHLYLALDGQEEGLSIHKLINDMDDGQALTTPLPEPAALEIVPQEPLPRSTSRRYFTAMGNQVIITANVCDELILSGQDPPIIAEDAKAASSGLSILPIMPYISNGFRVAVAVRDMLYVLSSPSRGSVIFKAILPSAPAAYSYDGRLPLPPFGPGEFVTSYAVHPDECTIFMTTRADWMDKGSYSFDTRHRIWKWHGEWVLPFENQGYYDSKLDAWVGLHSGGYICSCPIPSPSDTRTNVLDLDWVKGKEQLWCKRDCSMASLTYMGKNRYCLVEAARCEGQDPRLPLSNDHVLHLTFFTPKYNNEGELQAIIHHPVRSYTTSRYGSATPLGVSWM